MFAERLEATLENVDLASPARLARLVHNDLGNYNTSLAFSLALRLNAKYGEVLILFFDLSKPPLP
jgi:hypothetical protein